MGGRSRRKPARWFGRGGMSSMRACSDWALAVVCCIIAVDGHAQLIEDVDVVREERQAVVRVRFGAPIQYVRHAPATGGDLLKVEFQLVGNTTLDINRLEEFRKLKPAEGVPSFRLTYAATQAVRAVKNIQLRFAGPVRYRVVMGEDNRVLRILVPLPEETPGRTGRDGDLLPAGAPRDGFVLVLVTGTSPDLNAPPIPAGLQDYTVFTERRRVGAKTEYSLRMGFFATEDEAERVRRRVQPRFPAATVSPLARAAVAVPVPPPTAPTPAPASGVPPVPAPVATAPEPGAVVSGEAGSEMLAAAPPTPAQVDELALLGIARARSAMQAGQPGVAVEFLNQVLTLPPNAHSREAQALVGHARAANGEYAKARIEYQLYLTLYPEGPEAPSVKQSLAGLGPDTTAGPERGADRRERRLPPIPLTVTGSIAQSYNRGATKAETDTRIPSSNTVDRATFSAVDQSALVSSVDLNARMRSDEYDHRFVFRDTNVQNFLPNSRDTNQVSAAYYEIKSLPLLWAARLGRQTSTSSGVLGRFDGLQASFQAGSQWRLGTVAGKPVEFSSFDSRRRFAGLTVEGGPFFERWSGSGYAIDQRIDGVVDRRGVGGDIRYFDAQSSLYSLVDYDVYFHELGIFLVQGARSFDGGWSLTGLYDRRKAPPLQTANALLGEATTSLRQLLTIYSREQVEALARDRTAESRQGFVGITKQLSATWQAGVDFRYSNVGALPPSGTLPATPSTGNVYTTSVQLTASNLLGLRDITVLNASGTHSPTFRGRSYAVNHLFVLAERWTFEPAIRYYRQTDVTETELRRIGPSLRLYFRPQERVSLEGEVSWEETKTVSPTLDDRTTRHFVSLGYRWDF